MTTTEYAPQIPLRTVSLHLLFSKFPRPLFALTRISVSSGLAGDMPCNQACRIVQKQNTCVCVELVSHLLALVVPREGRAEVQGETAYVGGCA